MRGVGTGRVWGIRGAVVEAPGITYEIEPEDDIGYMERITFEEER